MGAMFLSDAVAVSGKLSEFRYSSDKGSEVTKVFRPNYGSPIFGKNTRMPDHLTLSLGTMDDASGLDVEVVYLSVTNLIGIGLEKKSFLSRHSQIGSPKTKLHHMQGGFSKVCSVPHSGPKRFSGMAFSQRRRGAASGAAFSPSLA